MYLRFLNAIGLTGFVRLEQLILFDYFYFYYCNHFIDAALCFLLNNVLAVYLVI